MPVMPAMFVALVSSGAKVMTVIVSPEPPEPPGSVPHPATRQAPVAVATRVRERDAARREMVMSMHHSAPQVTVE
ncbi:hypothetical protein GCM10010215_13780 [Streptomyces virginiae]|uniref:Secreted protein n=1 Tax=Streptomyces virginiae TaxID=1961 RepID=A0ABQ3NVS6_STRVG|nr:hypothetical protein GCM10010215_13780 [Streptomyces virginiae]GHI16859.1 hypothetical protein Scinn_63220 [Streptomyces virginiae]GLV90203.1 hypothetical protein Slala04_16570 [Streptomyces lavendulae subsp. lavendulae]